jgi:hypothetical protein
MLRQLTFGFANPAPEPLDRADDWIEEMLCAHRACDEVACSTIPVGGKRSNICYKHEREYVQRYGSEDVWPVGTLTEAPSSYHWANR